MPRSLDIIPIVSGFIGILVSIFIWLTPIFRTTFMDSPLSAFYTILGELRPIGFVLGSVIIYESYASEISNGIAAFWFGLGIGKLRYTLLKLLMLYISMGLYWLAIIVSLFDVFFSVNNSLILLFSVVLGDIGILSLIGFLISIYTQRVEIVILATAGFSSFIRGVTIEAVMYNITHSLATAIIEPASAATRILDIRSQSIPMNNEFFIFAYLGSVIFVSLSFILPLYIVRKRSVGII